MSDRVGLYPGSFDPVTFGHIDLIRRSLHVVDRLVVAILPNATKEALLTLAEREALLRSVIAAELGADVARVEILAASNLAVRIAEEAKASVIIRGLRAGSDFEAELRMAHANRLLAPSIETLFLMTAPEHASTSSRLVREIARYGGPLDRLVPEGVIPVLIAAARRHADANG
jgi:pantetheine-phosphate adenylyltransferase